MANKKISELAVLDSVASDDYIVIVDFDTGTTKSATVNLLPDTDTHLNHSGDIVSTSAGVATIQPGVVDIAMLSASGTASGTTFLRGDNTWEVVSTDPSLGGELGGTASSATITDNIVDEANLKVGGTLANDKVLTADSSATGGMKWADAGAGGTLDTKGDLEVFGTEQTRLGVGTDDYVLTADSAATHGVSWKASAAGSGGNTTTELLYEHAHTISSTYSITSGNNAMTAGPITVSSGGSVTVPTGSTWTIV